MQNHTPFGSRAIPQLPEPRRLYVATWITVTQKQIPASVHLHQVLIPYRHIM